MQPCKTIWVKELLHSLEFVVARLYTLSNSTPFFLRYEDQNYPQNIIKDLVLYSSKFMPFVSFLVSLLMMFNILLAFLAATVHSAKDFVACQWELQYIFSARLEFSTMKVYFRSSLQHCLFLYLECICHSFAHRSSFWSYLLLVQLWTAGITWKLGDFSMDSFLQVIDKDAE